MILVYNIPSLHSAGGIERIVTIKANYFADTMGWQVYVVTSSQRSLPLYYSLSARVRHIDLGIDYDLQSSRLSLKRLIGRWRQKRSHKRRLSALLRKLKADVVVSTFTHESSFLCDINDGSKKVLESHFSRHFRSLGDNACSRSLTRRWLDRVLELRDIMIARKYDKFVVLTEDDSQSWRHLRDVVVINNPAPECIVPQSDVCTKKVIAVGRLCRQKGFELLLDAWAIVRRLASARGWALCIYGEGPERYTLEAKALELGIEDSVAFMGCTSDMDRVYSSGSIFCLSSRYEGLSMALLEAMSHGLPVVAFGGLPGISEIIDNGKSGLLAEGFDVVAYADLLSVLIEDESLRLGLSANAVSAIRAKYSMKSVMSKWVDLFDDLTDGC